MLSFLLLFQNISSQTNNFYEVLTFKKNIEIKDLSNNPYKLITECFFNKSLNNEFLWGNTKINSGYSFSSLNIEKNELQNIKIDIDKLKLNLNKKDYDELVFYGFSSIIKTNKYTLFDVGNNLYLFKEKEKELQFQKKIQISDSIDFNFIFENSDSTIILLDYRASFDYNKKIKAHLLNLNTNKTEYFFEAEMGSNSACFDKANTRYYDVNKNYFLITDNLDYKIYLFNNKTNKGSIFFKPLNISENSRKILNPNNLRKKTLDSISIELSQTPRIINTQFINDSDIVVNYSEKADLNQNGIKIKNSVVDLLTVRNDTLVYKKTYNDDFYYEQINFKVAGKINQSQINPYLRSELYHFTVNNFLIKVTFKQLIPKPNTSFEKYIKKAKSSIFNLKSNLIYSIYEFHP